MKTKKRLKSSIVDGIEAALISITLTAMMAYAFIGAILQTAERLANY